MAFPFRFDSRLRQQFLLAIGTTGALSAAAASCTSKHTPNDAAPRAGQPGVAGKVGSAASGGERAVSGAGGPVSPAMCRIGMPGQECFTAAQMKQKATFGCGQIPIDPAPTEQQVAAKFLANGCLERTATCDGCCNPSETDGVPQGDGSCCYTFCGGSCCGRPFVVREAPQLAAAMPRRDWSASQARLTELGPLSERIAAEWLEDARMEHASIASFARFTLDLLAYGAPASLVEAAQRAGLDECEHARLCFGLAARFGSGDRGPAQLPAAGVAIAPSLWHAATAAFHEGCVNETFAAMQAAEACERATDPEAKRALERIAVDEAAHAELAWRFVAWSAARLGEPFHAHLERELATLQRMAAPGPLESETASARRELNGAGRLTARDKHNLDYTAVHEVIAPCVRGLLGRPAMLS